MSETGDVTVAKEIAAELLKLGLLEGVKSESFLVDLSAGKMTVDKWNLLGDPPPSKGGSDGK